MDVYAVTMINPSLSEESLKYVSRLMFESVEQAESYATTNGLQIVDKFYTVSSVGLAEGFRFVEGFNEIRNTDDKGGRKV